MSENYHTREEFAAQLANFTVGDRVQVLPHMWLFAAGAHYGKVEKIGRKLVTLRADVNDVTYRITPFGLDHIHT